MTPYHHACSSAQKWGGQPEDYMSVHLFLDSSKEHFPDFRHRAIYHHSAAIGLVPKILGDAITNSEGRAVPVRLLVEQHIREDCGFIPTVSDWLKHLRPEPWMGQVGVLQEPIEELPHQPNAEPETDKAVELLREILLRIDAKELAGLLSKSSGETEELEQKLAQAVELVCNSPS